VPTTLLLDSNVLGRVVHPDPAENRFVVNVVGALLIDPEYRLVVPEIIDYELRRSLLLNAGRNRRWASFSLAGEVILWLYSADEDRHLDSRPDFRSG
jgi:hypothetical protein